MAREERTAMFQNKKLFVAWVCVGVLNVAFYALFLSVVFSGGADESLVIYLFPASCSILLSLLWQLMFKKFHSNFLYSDLFVTVELSVLEHICLVAYYDFMYIGVANFSPAFAVVALGAFFLAIAFFFLGIVMFKKTSDKLPKGDEFA